jgi:hypothetical protein
MREVTYGRMHEIRQLLEVPIVSSGCVQGVFHIWHIGAPASFTIRELSSGKLSKVYYPPELYRKVHEATRKENSVLLVHGEIQWDRTTNNFEVSARDIEVTRTLSENEFDRIFGSMPNFTGNLSTSDYIDSLRGDGD